jgi:transcriptional regulator with XRE-family HTH domain
MKKRVVEVVAANVRERRALLEWSQEDLAAAAGLHRTYVGAIERAEKNVTLATLERVADALGLAVSELVRDPKGSR